MIPRRFRCSWAFWLLLFPWHSWAAGFEAKYDLHFKHWGEYYFSWQDWHWFKAQGMAESGLKASATSGVGALGLMQLMPATASELKVNPYDPEQNIQGGIHYDRKMWDFWAIISNFGERRSLAFASYNAGPGNIAKARKAAGEAIAGDPISRALSSVSGKHAEETLGYVRRIKLFFLQMR